MALNVGIDTLVGGVPVVGDLFDFAWKSNARNVKLLAGHLEAPARTRRASKALVIALLAAIAVLAVGVSMLGIYLIKRLFT